MTLLFFVLAAVCFALAALKPKLGAVGSIGWEWLAAMCLTIALWVV